MEQYNPTHSTGLLLNALIYAPIKKDLTYRGINRIADVLRASKGFNKNNIEEIHSDLRSKTTYASFKGIKKLLFVKGRI